MKKLHFLKVMSLSLVTLILFSCNNQNNTTTDPKPNSKPPRQIIPVEKAVTMYNTQNRIKDKVINPTLQKVYNDTTFTETEFAWFSLDEMRHYINYIDAIQKENPKEKVTGMRVYFGRYNAQTSKKYNNQQTVFFVPTAENPGMNSKYINLNHLPFAIKPDNRSNPIKGDFLILNDLVLDTDDQKKRINNYYKTQQQRKQEASLNPFSLNTLIIEEVTSTILNEGDLAPPPK